MRANGFFSLSVLALLWDSGASAAPTCGRPAADWSMPRVPAVTQWRDGQGGSHSLDELEDLLRRHKAWLLGTRLERKDGGDPCERKSEALSQEAKRLDLSHADLAYVTLADQDLRCALLEEATFTEATLSGSNFSFSQLRGAKFMGTDLANANFFGADLSGAMASNANLRSANLNQAILCGATLRGGDLSHVSLEKACLLEVTLNSANLVHASMERAILGLSDQSPNDHDGPESLLQGNGGASFECAMRCPTRVEGHASLVSAKLDNAWLMRMVGYRAWFTQASLEGANLTNSELERANFEGACLASARAQEASLRGANLEKADLTGATLDQADLADVVFEPLKPMSARGIVFADNLSHLTYQDNSEQLFGVQASLEASGFSAAARKVRAAISRRQASALEKVVFGASCDFRSDPLRPLMLLALFMVLFFLLYMISCLSTGESGLYLVVAGNPLQEGDRRIYRASFRSRLANGPPGSCRFWTGTKCALLFSARCALTLGPESLNILGQLVALLPFKEIEVKAFGWPRFVGGLQAILSVTLLILTLSSIAWP